MTFHQGKRLPIVGGLFSLIKLRFDLRRIVNGVVFAIAISALLSTSIAKAGWFGQTPKVDKLQAVVNKVADGDTVYLSSGEKVRLIGINTFELNNDRSGFARQAKKRLDTLLQGQTVRLELGEQEKDKYGRILAHLFVDDMNIQEVLLREGLAMVVAFPPNLRYINQYKLAEQQAQKEKRGIWAKPNNWLVDMTTKQGRKQARKNKGFMAMLARVEAIEQSRKNYRLKLAQDFYLTINKNQYEDAFKLDIDDYEDKLVLVRGWVSRFKGRRYVKIRHAVMLDIHE